MPLAARIADLRAYVDFGDEDAASLASVHEALAPDFARIARTFYDKTREHQEAHAVFTGEEQIARLQRSMEAWLHRLLGGTYDVAYYEQVARTGEVHVRVGLPQRYIFSSMSLIRLELEKLIEERAPAATARRTTNALHKAIDIELAVMLDAYRDALVARIERKQTLERDELASSLAQTERRYAAAIELTRDVVLVLDAGGLVRLFNAGAESATGFGREEIMGRPFGEMFLADASRSAFAQLLAESEEGTERLRIATSIKTRSGKLRDVRFEIARMPSGELLLMGHDGTEENALVRRAHQTEKLAAVGTLAAGLAHEIRNPLNGAQLHVAYLERTLKRANAEPDTLEAVRVVGDEIKRLATLVTEFLDFARPKPLTRKAASLATLIDRVMQLVEPDAKEANVTIARDLPTREIIADVDSAKIEQVVLNVARNAVEALAPQGGGNVTLRLRRQPNHAIVEIEDNGPGIATTDAPIFDAFYTTKPQGTGLGLAITHRIVTDHGGTIDVDSVAGRTVFRIALPVSIDSNEVGA